MMADNDDLDVLRDKYCDLILCHISAQKGPHSDAMAAGLLQAVLSYEAHSKGRYATAERLRDLADLIECAPGGGRVQ